MKQEKWAEENVSWKKSMRLKRETGEAGRRECELEEEYEA